MTTPAWTVRVAAGDAPTALIVERPDGTLVGEQDRAALYVLINGEPEPPDNPDRPPNLSDGRCEIVEEHPAHIATWHGDDGVDFDYWCSGAAAAAPVAEMVEDEA